MYFYANSIRPVYIKLADEDCIPGEESFCGRLNFGMHGMWVAALNGHENYHQHLIGMGFRQDVASPRLLHHPSRAINAFVHGDVYASAAHSEGFEWLEESMKKA